jgi:GWxTD domain-containing protein
VERSAPLMMAPLEETLQKDVARINFEKESDEGYFKYMSPEALDSAFAPLFYIADPNELKAWSKTLSDDAKRKFLTDFWVARDPTPNTPRDEAREQFYAAVDFANKNYRERTVPGWKTDRGRIYAKMGAPPQVLRRAQIQRAPPYEVWNYQDKGKWYIFADATGVGNWKLLISSDLKERKEPDWRDRLTEDGVRDSGRFLNVDFYSGQYKSY